MSKKVLGSSAFPIADQALVSGANFLTVIFIARALGPGAFGVYSLAWFVVLFFAGIQFALISAPMMSIGPKQDEGIRPAYFGVVFLQQAIFAAGTFVIVAAAVATSAIFAPQWGVGELTIPIALSAAAYQAKDFLRRYFFLLGRRGAALSVDITSYCGQVGIVAWLFVSGSLTASSALWAVVATSSAAILVGGLLVQRLTWSELPFREVTRRHWRFARWLAADAVLQFSAGYLYVIVAGAALGPTAVGALRAAQNLMGVNQVIALGLQNVLPAKASWHFHHQGAAGLLSYIQSVALTGGTVTIVVGIAIGATPEFWLGLVFGDAYVGFGGLVRWFAVIYVLVFVQVLLQAALKAVEHTMPIFVAAVLSAFVALVSAYPLIHAFGVTGAAMGFLLVLIVSISALSLGLLRWLRGLAGGRHVKASVGIRP